MPLAIAPENKLLNIVKIASSDVKIKKHLESLGFVENEKITLLSKSNGNVICLIKGFKLALNKELALKIYVS